MTTLEDIREKLEIERANPGTYSKVNFIWDVEYLLGEIQDLEQELELTKGLISWQCGAELDPTVM